MNRLQLFAVAAPGLAALTARELAGLGLRPAVTQEEQIELEAGVEFAGDLHALYRANLGLRTASRVLVRLGQFYAAGFPELRRKISHLAWEAFLVPGQPVALRVTCRKSKLYHSDAVAERVAQGIADHLGQPVSPQRAGDDEESQPVQLIVVRLLHDHCTVSVDSSGALLHQRGYRLAAAKAPLRETLAAGMLLASGWDPAAPLLDPFCGSGTIAIEAALLRRGLAPGLGRRFAFMDWPGFRDDLWGAERRRAEGAQAKQAAPASLFASDRDAGAITAAQANAERAGVAEMIQFSRQAVSDLAAPPGPGWVVTNPPYGVRVRGGPDLRNLYARLGDVLRARCPGWQVALLAADPALARATGLRFDSGLPLVNGGLRVRLLRGRV